MSDQSRWVMEVCDVCRWVDGDRTQKLCYWCGVCKAWICKADEFRMDRRATAMVKRAKGSKSCNSCTEKKDQGQPMYDDVLGKRVSEMTDQERKQYALRVKSKEIMAQNLPLETKRKQVQALEKEYETW